MKSTLALLAALAVFARSASAADQTISFRNNNLGSPRLVTFGPEVGELAGSGVRNGVADGASFVAQLFRLDGEKVFAIGWTANFRPLNTSQPGTWVGTGAIRTVLGVPQGTPMILQVKAWDATHASPEQARAAGKLWGESAPFPFQDAMSDPPAVTDNFMVNFPGFSIQGYRVGVVPEPQTVVLGLLGCAAVLWLPRRPAR
jgi:hypothetical protein